ncbi:Histone-Lysine N-Methyltransferase ash1l, partial [Rhizophlyctis rosea]
MALSRSPPPRTPSPQPYTAASDAESGSDSTEEEDGVIRCICGIAEDDGYTIQCERCFVWQHVACFGLKGREPDHYLCEVCQPRKVDKERARQIQNRGSTKDKDRERQREKDLSSRKQLQPSPKKRKTSLQHATSTDTTKPYDKQKSTSSEKSRLSTKKPITTTPIPSPPRRRTAKEAFTKPSSQPARSSFFTLDRPGPRSRQN